MLSSQTRLRVEFICDRIAKGAPVELNDMSWVQKLADRNPTVATWLRQARRSAIQGDHTPSSMDSFCQALDLGEPDPAEHLSGPQDPITLAEWFSSKQKWFRGSC
ncbi:MAG: hypothetical protein ACO3P1_12885 [Pseudomonadales bacterium]